MDGITIIIALVLVAWLNHYLATQRGRSPFGWAAAGVILGLFSTILLLVLGKTREKEIEVIVEAQKRV